MSADNVRLIDLFHNRTPIRNLKIPLCCLSDLLLVQPCPKVCVATVVQSAYGADILLQMVYVVGGYKLTREQVLEWGRPHNLQPSEGNTTLCVNRWLKSQGIKTRLLACDYEEKCIFLVVTARKYDGKGTLNKLEEDDRARGIKDRCC
jgi:hypothetical protein